MSKRENAMFAATEAQACRREYHAAHLEKHFVYQVQRLVILSFCF
jgi:hypothetical protein